MSATTLVRFYIEKVSVDLKIEKKVLIQEWIETLQENGRCTFQLGTNNKNAGYPCGILNKKDGTACSKHTHDDDEDEKSPRCPFVITRGENKGKRCGVKIKSEGEEYCARHLKTVASANEKKDKDLPLCKAMKADKTQCKKKASKEGLCHIHFNQLHSEKKPKKGKTGTVDIERVAIAEEASEEAEAFSDFDEDNESKTSPSVDAVNDTVNVDNDTVIADAEYDEDQSSEEKEESDTEPVITTCQIPIKAGQRKGQACGKPLVAGYEVCSLHLKSRGRKA